MKKHRITVPVTNDNVDIICDYYTLLGWKEIDVNGSENHIQSITFEIECDGVPRYPATSDIK